LDDLGCVTGGEVSRGIECHLRIWAESGLCPVDLLQLYLVV
jgi:hypothetical protein